MARKRKWSDADLVRAVDSNTTLNGVVRDIGLSNGGSQTTAVVRRLNELGIDFSHLNTAAEVPLRKTPESKSITLSDDEFKRLVADSSAWVDVKDALNIKSGGGHLAIKQRADRMGLDTSHFKGKRRVKPIPLSESVAVDFGKCDDSLFLRHAAPHIASAWFMRKGYMVSLPLEPCRYDLVVDSDTGFKRIQAKSTTRTSTNGKWTVGIRRTEYNRTKPLPYTADEIDYLFIARGDGVNYLIPVAEVEGKIGLTLDDKYIEYELD